MKNLLRIAAWMLLTLTLVVSVTALDLTKNTKISDNVLKNTSIIDDGYLKNNESKITADTIDPILAPIKAKIQIDKAYDCGRSGSGLRSTPIANPDFNPGLNCELKIVVVIDESGSIVNEGNENNVRDGVQAFFTEIKDKAVDVAVVEFNTRARLSIGYTEVTSANSSGAGDLFYDYLYDDMGGSGSPDSNRYDPEDNDNNEGWTNWEEALDEISSLATPPDLVLFFTDGDPNAYISSGSCASGCSSNAPSGYCTSCAAASLDAAILAANTVKALPTHIFVVGFPNPTLNVSNVIDISDSDEYGTAGVDFNEADYVEVTGTSQLVTVFGEIAGEICGIDLNLTKTTDNDPANVGDAISFEIVVNNEGNIDATGVEVKEYLPAGYTFTSASASQGTYDNNTGLWTVGTVEAGMSKTLTINATINSSGSYNNCAEIWAVNETDGDSTPGNGSANGFTEDDEDCEEICVYEIACNGGIDENLSACTPIPAAYTDPADVFTYNACGQNVTMEVTPDTDMNYCDGADFTRTYTLKFDGVAQSPTCSQQIVIAAQDDFTVPADGGETVLCYDDTQSQPTPPVVNDACGNSITPSIAIPSGEVCEGDVDWVFTYSDCAGHSHNWTYTYTVKGPEAGSLTYNDDDAVCIGDVSLTNVTPTLGDDQFGEVPTIDGCFSHVIMLVKDDGIIEFVHVTTALGVQAFDLSGLPAGAYFFALLAIDNDDIASLPGGSLAGLEGQPLFSLIAALNTGLCHEYYVDDDDLTISPLPDATIMTDATVCQCDDDVDITITAIEGKAPWTIDYTFNGMAQAPLTIPVGQTTSILTQDVSTPGTYVYNLTHIIDARGCEQDLDKTVTITVNPSNLVFNETLPVSTTVECEAIPEAAVLTAKDNCNDDAYPVTFTEVISDAIDCPSNYTITRTWTVTDCEEQNSLTHTQVLTVDDTTAPEADQEAGSADFTGECDDDLAIPLAFEPTFTDNCTETTGLVITMDSDMTTPDADCDNAYVRIRKWTAKDGCDNVSAEFIQTITISDNTAPVGDQPPGHADFIGECDDDLTDPLGFEPTFTDNCTNPGDITVTMIADETTSDSSCPNAYVRVRKWTADDGCGNISAEFVQTITISDNTAPVGDQPPGHADFTGECDDDLTEILAFEPTFTDNCTNPGDITVTMIPDETTPDSSCPNAYVLVRKWTADDGCGNTSDVFIQTITISDNTAPVGDQPPGHADFTGECDDDLTEILAFEPTFTDNCTNPGDIAVTMIADDTTYPNPDCAYEYTRVRKWTADDGCGNISDVFIQTITITDDTAPEITCPDAGQLDVLELNADCEGVIPAYTPGVSDNCEASGDITIVQDPAVGSTVAAGSTVTITLTATDCAGNSSDCTFDVTVEPLPTVEPVDDYVYCNGDSGDAIALASANAGATISWTATTDVGFGTSGTGSIPAYTATNATSNALVSTVTVSADKNGCVQTEDFTVTVNPDILLSVTYEEPSCNGFSNGTATVTVNQGVGPFTYQWDDPANQTTATATGLEDGTYTVTVEGDNGCSNTISVTITEPDKLDAEESANLICFGSADGQISITVTGGTPFPGDNPATPEVENGYFLYDWDYDGTGDFDDPKNPSGLTAGTYQGVVLDANNCTTEIVAVIAETDEIVVESIVPTHVTCNGDANGSIDLTVSGGFLGLSYEWKDDMMNVVSTVEDPTGLPAGTYYVTITDGLDCTATSSVEITEPDALVIADPAMVVDVSCFGESTGSIDITVSGGTPGYTYSWSNGATSEDVSGLAAGTYTVTVTDGNGCTASANITIAQPTEGLSATGDVTNVQCNDDSGTSDDGSIDLTVTGGTPGYTYTWSNGATTEDLSGLAAGTYTVTVTDDNDCTTSASFTITQPDQLAATGVVTNVTCNDDSGTSDDGGIDLTVTGGTPGYTYSWSNGATTEDVSGLAAGTYTVTVTDDNGCTTTASFTITQPDQLTTIGVLTNILCNDDSGPSNDGIINLSVSGGTPGYTYSWSNGATTEDLSGLAAGTYTVTVTDSNGCTTTASFTITQPNQLTATGVTSDVTCNDDSGTSDDGSIDLTVTGGATSYGYSWSNGATTEDVSGLAAGTYTVTVNDAFGCTTTASFTITQPDQLTATGVTSDVTCNDDSGTSDDGSIDLTVAGGTPSYTYAWSNGATTEDVSGLAAGTYSVTVTDDNGCTSSKSFTITQPDQLMIDGSPAIVGAKCNGESNGSIDISVSGGTPSYTYSWSNGATTEDISGLAAGMYTVMITDDNGCTTSGTFTVDEPEILEVDPDPTVTDVSCTGFNNGAIDVTVTGGTTPYTFAWVGPFGFTSSDEDIEDLFFGTYTLTVTDANGCMDDITVVIDQPELLDFQTNANTVSCDNPLGFVVVFEGNAGVPGTGGGTPFIGDNPETPAVETSYYLYDWDEQVNSGGLITYAEIGDSNDPAQISNLPAGTYRVIVTDANGCNLTRYATINPVDGYIPVQADFDYVVVSALDVQFNNNSISGSTYMWDFGDGTTSTDENPMHTYASSGVYTVCLTAADDCGGFDVICKDIEDNLPDLTPNIYADQTTFSPGQSRDLVIEVIEIRGNPTDGSQIRFTIPITNNFDYTFDQTAISANVFGGFPVDNSEWSVTNNGFAYIFTYIGVGNLIGGNGASYIGVTVSRNSIASSIDQSNFTVTIVGGSGGEVEIGNNQTDIILDAIN